MVEKKQLSLLIGDRIRFYRTNANLTQSELAERIGISPNYLGQLERAEKTPPIATLDKIVTALGISLAQFFEHMSTDANNPNTVINDAYQLLLELSPAEQKLAYEVILNLVKITKL